MFNRVFDRAKTFLGVKPKPVTLPTIRISNPDKNMRRMLFPQKHEGLAAMMFRVHALGRKDNVKSA